MDETVVLVLIGGDNVLGVRRYDDDIDLHLPERGVGDTEHYTECLLKLSKSGLGVDLNGIDESWKIYDRHEFVEGVLTIIYVIHTNPSPSEHFLCSSMVIDENGEEIQEIVGYEWVPVDNILDKFSVKVASKLKDVVADFNLNYRTNE